MNNIQKKNGYQYAAENKANQNRSGFLVKISDLHILKLLKINLSPIF
jgi:hypothetical protein